MDIAVTVPQSCVAVIQHKHGLKASEWIKRSNATISKAQYQDKIPACMIYGSTRLRNFLHSNQYILAPCYVAI